MAKVVTGIAAGKAVKVALRKRVRELVAAASSERLAAASATVVAAVVALPEYAAAQTVGAYMAMPSEVNLRALLARAFMDGKQVALPRVGGSRTLMDMALVSSLAEIDTLPVVAPFGIQEPGPDARAAHTVDLMLVPGVAFDRAGGRCGHGAGYYDRLFPKLFAAHARAGARAPTLVGVALAEQLVDEVPMAELDVRMDNVIVG